MAQQLHSWVYIQERQNTNLKRCMHPSVHRSIIYNSQGMKQLKCPSAEEWMRKMQCINAEEKRSAITKKRRTFYHLQQHVGGPGGS